MSQIQRHTFIEESAYEKHYTGKKEYDGMFNQKVKHLVNKDIKMGYWVKGVFNEHLDGHHILEHFATEQVQIARCMRMARIPRHCSSVEQSQGQC